MAHLRLIVAVACATAAAAAPTSSHGLPASARRAGRRPAGERALAAHLGRPRLQRRRVVPLLGGAMCACTWHFFYNSESLEEGSSIGMKPPLCLDMDRMSGLRERDVSLIGTLLDGIGRCSSLAPRQDNQQQQQRKQPAHAPMALRRKRLRLRRRRETRRRSDGMEMEMVNLKLYLENRCILEENERLREKASALHRENLALRADLRNTSSPATTAAAASSC
ncbi:hypothetical protein OsI_32073 [Oryza sativa Indica Group]|uniref:Uncharacterized protein n=1 Tax=Oryza sativa subsp. indica TaxID=39946 RepID=B8BDK3_ORYSI|nr:hypothetical protein OsI_32073 [Oryza sativa Indica Group]